MSRLNWSVCRWVPPVVTEVRTMTSTLLLRECIRGILLEKTEMSNDEIILSSDDILFSLTRNPEVSKLHGVEVFTPYRVRKTMPSSARLAHLTGLTPFNVASTTKYDSVDDKKVGKRLKAEPDAAAQVLDLMADEIRKHFEESGVVAVSCVDSSEKMSENLARAVAAKLEVPYQAMIKKSMDPNLTWDPGEWKAYEDMIRSTGKNGKGQELRLKGKLVTPDEYLASVKAVLNGEIKWLKDQIVKGKKPSMAGGTNTDTGHKRFFNFFDKVAAGDLAKGSKVLIVDDNVDSGWTPYHVAKRAREAGLTPLFAAGFKMMRYYEKKAPSKTPELDKAIGDLEKLADEFANDLFQVGNYLIAKFNSERRGVMVGDVYKVLKAKDNSVELTDVDTGNVVRLQGPFVKPEQAERMWVSAA